VLNSSKQHFTNLKNRLDSFINSHHVQKDESLENYWRTEISQLQSNGNYFTYDSEYTELLITRANTNLNDRNNFIGSILAYEFDFKDKSKITERRKNETATFSKIKNDLRKQLSESEKQLTEHLTNANQDYKNYTKLIDDFKLEKEGLFNDWFEGNEEILGAKKKIAYLEHTYEELLRLKKPAEYWKTRAAILKSEGWKAVYWLIGLVVFACLTLYLLLWLTPEGMQLSFVKRKHTSY
jgi:hypothetical protein